MIKPKCAVSTFILAIAVTSGCVEGVPPSSLLDPLRCDEMIGEAIKKIYVEYEEEEVQYVREDIENSRALWTGDSAYALVREQVAAIPGVLAIVRVEIGGAPAGAYASLWSLVREEGTIELLTLI
jgi:hypothetical protein